MNVMTLADESPDDLIRRTAPVPLSTMAASKFTSRFVPPKLLCQTNRSLAVSCRPAVTWPLTKEKVTSLVSCAKSRPPPRTVSLRPPRSMLLAAFWRWKFNVPMVVSALRTTVPTVVCRTLSLDPAELSVAPE